MQKPQFQETLEKIVAGDPRYASEAYVFVREALDFTQKAVARASKGEPRHVKGQELLAGIRDYALSQYGPMALDLLHEWGVRRCEDFGEIVFNLIEAGVLSKTEDDTRGDFAGGYAFEEAFRKPFLPSTPRPPHGQTPPVDPT